MDDTEIDGPTRQVEKVEAGTLVLLQNAEELADLLETLADRLEEQRTMSQRSPGDPTGVSTAVGDAETARVTAARARVMAETFRAWPSEPMDPARRRQDLTTWRRVQDAAQSLGIALP